MAGALIAEPAVIVPYSAFAATVVITVFLFVRGAPSNARTARE